jgi:hypothetical protein
MAESVRLRPVEEEHVVGVGDDRAAAVGPPEDTAADKDDAVSGVRFLRSARLDVSPASEVDNRDARRLKEERSSVVHDSHQYHEQRLASQVDY